MFEVALEDMNHPVLKNELALTQLIERLNELEHRLTSSDYDRFTIDMARICVVKIRRQLEPPPPSQVEDRPIVHDWEQHYCFGWKNLQQKIHDKERDGWTIVQILNDDHGYMFFINKPKKSS